MFTQQCNVTPALYLCRFMQLTGCNKPVVIGQELQLAGHYNDNKMYNATCVETQTSEALTRVNLLLFPILRFVNATRFFCFQKFQTQYFSNSYSSEISKHLNAPGAHGLQNIVSYHNSMYFQKLNIVSYFLIASGLCWPY